MPNNKELDAEPPIASFLKSMLIGGGPVNAAVLKSKNQECRRTEEPTLKP